MRRIGTGEVPVTGLPVGFVPLPQPLTLSTVRLLLPFTSTALMNTCKNPTNVRFDTALVGTAGLAIWS